MLSIDKIKNTLNLKSKEELEDIRNILNALIVDIDGSLDMIRQQCKHEVVMFEGGFDHHKGDSSEVVCKSCGRSMYLHDDNYYPYPISNPRDNVKRILEEI